jgi:hypothetical protein
MSGLTDSNIRNYEFNELHFFVIVKLNHNTLILHSTYYYSKES